MINLSKNLLKHFKLTNKFVFQSILQAGGWNPIMVNTSIPLSELSFGYVYDWETNFAYTFSVSKQEFFRISSEASEFSELEKNQIVDATSNAIAEAQKTRDPDFCENNLVPMIIIYAGTTNTWLLADKMVNGGHFILCRYKVQQTGGYSIRPLFMSALDGNNPLTTDEFKKILNIAHEQDKVRHPEWFV